MYTHVLGSESDDELFNELSEAVSQLGGTITDSDWALGGSQEIATYKITLPSGEIFATSETYVGLSLQGSEDVVRQLAEKVSGMRS